MGYNNNPWATGYEVFVKSGFSVESHGSIETTASYLFDNSEPNYAVRFYHPSEHEVFSQIKYGNFEAGYNGLNEVRENMNGMPMEFYVPHSTIIDSGVGRQDVSETKIPQHRVEIVDKYTANEITKAQEQIRQRSVKITVEETFMVKRKRSITLESREG